jgi:pimeloyl-ACP methyl ester carboxylesterase
MDTSGCTVDKPAGRYLDRPKVKNERQVRIQLAHEDITTETATQCLYVLHGVFGAGRNWATVARRLVRDLPDWAVRLVDLRQHGGSQGFAAPHTLAAAARDLYDLADQTEPPPAGVLGHSFGGKVALMYAREHGAGLRQLWVIDSSPDASEPRGSAWDMLQLVRAAPEEFEARQDLVAYLSERGIPVATAQWMATNLERGNRGYRWRFELGSIEELLQSFFATDLWDVIEQPPPQAQVHVVKAQESSVLGPAAVSRIRNIADGNKRVHVHEVSGGHWVNADNPDALLELLKTNL